VAEAGQTSAADAPPDIGVLPAVWVPPPDLSRFNRLLGPGTAEATEPSSET
jgi:hypothetical protein